MYNGWSNWETWEFYNWYSDIIENMGKYARSKNIFKSQILDIIEATTPSVEGFWKSVMIESVKLIDIDDIVDTVWVEDDLGDDE